jgi:hypothetical protein
MPRGRRCPRKVSDDPAIRWRGTTRYVPKADPLLIKRLGFFCTEIMYELRLQPIAADVSRWVRGAPASACGDACKGAFSKVGMI